MHTSIYIYLGDTIKISISLKHGNFLRLPKGKPLLIEYDSENLPKKIMIIFGGKIIGNQKTD